MKIVNIKKFIKSILIILAILLGFSLISSKSTLSYKETEYKTIFVDYGDTLWGIAETLQENNAYYKGKDIRYIISDIKKINNLTSSNLWVEQELQIPII